MAESASEYDVLLPRGTSRSNRGTFSPPRGSPRSEDSNSAIWEIEDHYFLKPEESVYSYYLYMPPVEYLRHNTRWNWVWIFATGTVILNFVMQLALILIVGDFVIRDHESMVSSILRQSHAPWYALHHYIDPSLRPLSNGECRSSESLCHPTEEGRISCAPPSIALLEQWDLLDTDGDGVWSRAEADDPDYRALTRCQYNIDVLLLYEDVLLTIRRDPELEGKLVAAVDEGSGIPKPYYDYFVGEPMMCVYGDSDMCGNLFAMGVFDEAIRHNASRLRGITDFNSALDYCLDLLGNRCEHMLPNSYRGWVSLSVEKCGAKVFTPAVYNSTVGGVSQATMTVDFQQRLEYQNAHTFKFLLFLWVLVVVFFSTMLEEWKLIYRVILYLLQFEHFNNNDSKGDPLHKPALTLITMTRFMVWVFLLYAGTIFLTSGTEYLQLIFDALSLVFIIQIDELLYRTLLRGPMRQDHSKQSKHMLKRRRLCLSVMTLEFAMVFGVLLAAAVVTYVYSQDTLVPIMQALNCVCLVEGNKCEEAVTYTKDFWKEYWTKVLPASMKEINRLKPPLLNQHAGALRGILPLWPGALGGPGDSP